MTFCEKANRYIADVLSKKIPACGYVRKTCKRQRDDLKKKAWKYHFDENRAERVCKFISALQHVKGPLAGQNIVLEPWQCFILTTVFGWVDDKGLRRFQQVYIEVPRGNGKSLLCSGIGLYMLCADGEKGADVYSFATTRDQAGIVFGDAQQMARGNPNLREAFGVQVLAHSIVVPGTNSKFQAKSADGSTLDGLNTHLGIIDELHAHRTREVYDVVKTSIGKRAQPLLWCITTAGFNLTGICMERHGTKLLDGSVRDETNFGVISTIDETDDWRDANSLIKANPNWGVSVQPKAILANLSMALTDPSAENNFRTKHLDEWRNADAAWLQMSRWRKCIRDVELTDFAGRQCIYGIDLATKLDITAVVKLFWRTEDDGKFHYYLFGDYWLPSERIETSLNSQYKGWAQQDLLHVTDGPITDLSAIERWLKADVQKYDPIALAYDPWNASQLAQDMMQEGAPMVEIKPTLQNFSEPMKTMQSLVYEKRLHTDGDPVLEWMVSNVVCHTDAKDNVYPRKETKENKIDGVVASIMAINQALFLRVEEDYSDQYDVSDVQMVL